MCRLDAPHSVGVWEPLSNEQVVFLHELLVMGREKIPVGTACFVDGKPQVG